MIRSVVVLFLCTLLSACSQGQVIRNASIERVEVEVLLPDPPSVRVTAYGSFISGCMTLHETEQRREGDTFFVKITTAEPADTVCTPNAPPFVETVVLDADDLSSGTYTLNVNGVTETFTLP